MDIGQYSNAAAYQKPLHHPPNGLNYYNQMWICGYSNNITTSEWT